MNVSGMKELQGIIAALLTPFDTSGRVDYGAVKAEIDFIIDFCEADAVSVGAVDISEYVFLSVEERKELIKRSIEIVGGRIPVIAGVSDPSIETAVELSRFSAECGADYAQALVQHLPWGGQPQPEEVLTYFQQLGDLTTLPIVAYLHAGPGADLNIPSTIALSRNPKVHAFKESSRDLKRVGRLIEEICHAGHALYSTTMEMLLITLQLGGAGATMPPPAVRIAKDIMIDYREGRLANAIASQRIFSVLNSRFGARGLLPWTKASLKIIGIDIGDPHFPYEPLDKRETEALKTFFRDHNLFEL